MARPKNYTDLIVWQKAMALALQTYKVSQALPKNETYGLLSQIRRAAISVPSNIAEGHGRLTDNQFRHFLGNARGSLYEMETQLRLAADLGYLDEQTVSDTLEKSADVARSINALIAAISRASSADSANSACTAKS